MDYLAPLMDYVQCCASHRRLNVDLRHQFSDQPGPKYKFCVISIITLKRFEGEPETKNAELHKTVRQAVEEAGGSVESLQKQLWRQQCSNEPHASDGVDRAQISALMRELKMSPLSLSTHLLLPNVHAGVPRDPEPVLPQVWYRAAHLPLHVYSYSLTEQHRCH